MDRNFGMGLNLCQPEDNYNVLRYEHYGVNEGLDNKLVQLHSGWISMENSGLQLNMESQALTRIRSRSTTTSSLLYLIE